MADRKTVVGRAEDDMSANAPLPQSWRDEVAARNAAVRDAIVVPAPTMKPPVVPVIPRGQEVGQESRSSKVYQRGFKSGGSVRGHGAESKGKTKGKFR